MNRLTPLALFVALLLALGVTTADAKRAAPPIQVSLEVITSPNGRSRIEGVCKMDISNGDIATIYIEAPDGSIAPTPFQRGRAVPPPGGVHWVQHLTPTLDGHYTLTCQHSTPDGRIIAVARAHLDYTAPQP